MDIDKYRQPWESDEHWVFRKEFIITHRERFPNEDRLLCLAQVFANVELLGCSYPQPVMDQINELSQEITEVQKLRDKRSERTVVKFVKDTSEGASRYSGTKRGSSGNFNDGPAKKNPHQSYREYSNIGSANRATAASLFNADSSGTQIASYYTVKGASQSRHHQGETPLSPSVRSYQSIQFVKSNDSNLGNSGVGERGLSHFVTHKPFVVDCDKICTNSEVSSKSENIDDSQEVIVSVTEIQYSKFEALSRELDILMSKDAINKITNVGIACSKQKMKIKEDCHSNRSVCDKSCCQKNFFNCALCIDDILVGFGTASKKKIARNLAYDDAIKKLKKKQFEFFPLVNWYKPMLKLSTSCDGANVSDQVQQCPCFEKKLETKDTVKAVAQQPGLGSGSVGKEIHESKPITYNLPYNSFESQLRSLSDTLEEVTIKHSGNALQILDIACRKVGMYHEYVVEAPPEDIVKPLFIASLKLGKVLVGKAHGSKKKEARLKACESALNLLSTKNFKVVSDGFKGKSELRLVASNDSIFSSETRSNVIEPALHLSNNNLTPKATSKSKTFNETDLSRGIGPPIFSQKGYASNNARMHYQDAVRPKNSMLIIDDQFVNPHSNEISRLIQSCNLNKTPVEFDFGVSNVDNQLKNRCTVKIAGKIEGIGVGETKQISKLDACKIALKNLQERIYTVQVKQVVSSNAKQINKHQVRQSNVQQNQQSLNRNDNESIDSDNVGFKMLQMMGWKGGGIGKQETGIETPISVKDIYEREGLGFSDLASLNRNFKTNIQKIISDFSKSHYANELKFSPDFSKEERKYIHSLADKFHLKAVSKGGRGSGRYLVLSHKMNPQQLLHCLLSMGGSNEKYTLIPPMSAQ